MNNDSTDWTKGFNFDFGPLKEAVRGFENIDKVISAMDYPQMDYSNIIKQVNENIPEFEPIIPEGYFEKVQEYQEKSLEILQSINQNTANLYSIVDLIKNSNDKQDEMIELLSDIFLLAKVKDKEEADSMFKQIMTKINDTADTAESIIKLSGWAMAIYNMVISFLPR